MRESPQAIFGGEEEGHRRLLAHSMQVYAGSFPLGGAPTAPPRTCEDPYDDLQVPG
jgi:hypothetical protein